MEMEDVHKEQTSLENQLASLRKQIANLTSEVEVIKKKVQFSADYSFSCALQPIQHFLPLDSKLLFFNYVMQVASLGNDHDQAQSELNIVRSKLRECDTQISFILKEQQKLQHKITENNLERKKMENEVFLSQLKCFMYMRSQDLNLF